MADPQIKPAAIGNVIEVVIANSLDAGFTALGLDDIRRINAAIANVNAGKVIPDDIKHDLSMVGVRVYTRHAMDF